MHSIIVLFVAGLLTGSATFGVLPSGLGVLGPDSDEPPGTEEARQAPSAAEFAERRQEILWLARVMYSETKISDEMRLVGWVVRNRVETGFRGKTYKQVATSDKQFSGLTPGERGFDEVITFDYAYPRNRSWQAALEIAEEVFDANVAARPFPVTVRHFYSPHVLQAGPSWTDAGTLHLEVAAPDGSHSRFAFYDGVK